VHYIHLANYMNAISLPYPVSVGILYFDDGSEDTMHNYKVAVHVANALRRNGHAVRLMQVDKTNVRKAARVCGQVVFNFVEDPCFKLYEKVGRLLEQMGRAQVGIDMKSIKIMCDKAAVKRRLVAYGVPTPKHRVVAGRGKRVEIRGLEYPLIVKPAGEHAGVGISQDSVVIDKTELEERVNFVRTHFPGDIIVEEYIEGRELQVTVMGNGIRAVVLPAVELDFQGEFRDNWSIYSYDAKWSQDSWEYWSAPLMCPAVLPRKIEERMNKVAKAACVALGFRDISRVDVRIDQKGRPFVLDVNASPSIGQEDDMVWRSAREVGWSYTEFLETLVAITYKRVYKRLPDRILERQWLLAEGRTV
jgi:D-alanine-D-alanine ligase